MNMGTYLLIIFKRNYPYLYLVSRSAHMNNQFEQPGAKKAMRKSPGYFNQILTFESRKWSTVATSESWNNKSGLSFFDFRLFHLQKQVLTQIGN